MNYDALHRTVNMIEVLVKLVCKPLCWLQVNLEVVLCATMKRQMTTIISKLPTTGNNSKLLHGV